MVQTISLETITKDISPKKSSSITKQNGNDVDFLELLMKDLDGEKPINVSSIQDEKQSKLKKENFDDKKQKDSSQENKLEIKDFKIDKNLNLNFEPIKIDSDKKFSEKQIKEIKNIISSKMEQNNIILTKTQEKEFKKIDNINDLLKFADKRGLNVKEIKFELAKLDNKLNETNLSKLQNQGEIKAKKESYSHKKMSNSHVNSSQNHTKKDVNSSQKSVVSLEDILNQQKSKSSNKSQVEKQKNVKTTDTFTLNTTKEKEIKEIEKNRSTLITTKQVEPKKTSQINLMSLLNVDDKSKKVEKVVNKLPENQINLNTNNQNLVNEVKLKSIQAKETLNSFKNNLDEAIKNYKPPISKVNIELNPKNLGKVEVSIIQRGNEIKVHMNTDQSNVQLFQTHQAEFRQALSNIGFSNIDMSFNSNQNQDRERKQNQAKKSYKENEVEEIPDIEIKADYRYA